MMTKFTNLHLTFFIIIFIIISLIFLEVNIKSRSSRVIFQFQSLRYLINETPVSPNSLVNAGPSSAQRTRPVVLTARQPGPLSLVDECRGSALIGQEDHSVATPALLCHKDRG